MDLSSTSQPAATQTPPLNPTEDLPVFCEACGYSLHGLPATRCGDCSLLYHRCPECGHTQPINTLRPAAQRMLGRAGAWMMGAWLCVKILFFIFAFLIWGLVGDELGRNWHEYKSLITRYAIRPVEWRFAIAAMLLSACFGFVSRLLVLGRRAHEVAMVLIVLVPAALFLGAKAGQVALQRQQLYRQVDPSYAGATLEFVAFVLSLDAAVLWGAMLAWPIWKGLAHLLLPRQAARAMLAWQKALGPDGLEPES